MLKENAKIIKDEIIKRFKGVNKYGESITVVAASKTVDTGVLNELKSLDIFICGENRVQEFLKKCDLVDTTWHFIGNLQTNKVKYIVDKVDLIQSCNSLKLLNEIDRQSEKIEKVSKVLIEVNIAKENSKTGILKDELDFILNKAKTLKNISVKGLMAVMPYVKNPEINKDYYLQMRSVYDRIKSEQFFEFEYLSMGMSDDYITAIENGANMVRLGTCLFGVRNY